jgi:predicted house-cleaning noncanonical NTP pyrophosphatase (MazG superfamily)
MLTPKEMERLGDDLKMVAKAVKVMGQENDQIKRAFALGLVEDLFNRLYEDICEMKERKNV